MKSRAKHVFALAAAMTMASAAMVSFTASEAGAYNLLGCKWGSAKITYKNLVTGGDLTPTNNAIANWNNNTSVNFASTTGTPRVTLNNGGYGNTGWDGIASYTCTGGTFNTGSLVRLNDYYLATYSAGKRRSVMSHELGHVIGLGHRSTGTCIGRSVMYPYTDGRYDDCIINTATADDIAGANALY